MESLYYLESKRVREEESKTVVLTSKRQLSRSFCCWNSFLTKGCGPIFRWIFRQRRLSEEPELGHDLIVTVNPMS